MLKRGWGEKFKHARMGVSNSLNVLPYLVAPVGYRCTKWSAWALVLMAGVHACTALLASRRGNRRGVGSAYNTPSGQ